MSDCYSLGKLTIVTLSGKDRNKIANNLCTQEVRSLADGNVTETFVTDVKGRTLSHGVMLGLLDQLWFVSSPGQGDRLIPHFDRYIIREDAVVSDASSDWDAYLFRDVNFLVSTFNLPSTFVANDGPLCVAATRDDVIAMAIRVPWVAGGGGLVLLPVQGPNPDPWSDIRSCCVPSDTTHREGWEAARIEAFWPWYGVDCDERNLPQELGIDSRAISFKKGCYLGQETVARLDALGQVQKKLVTLQIEGPDTITLPCSIRVEDKEIGTITSMATNAKGDRVALALIRRSHFSVGTRFQFGNQHALVLDH